MEDLYTMLEQADSEEDYREILERLRWSSGFSCPRCGHNRGYRIESRRLIECKQCNLQVSATSGTLLHGVRDLRAWVKAILSFMQTEGLSAVSVAKLFDLGYATAWFMMQKIRWTLESGVNVSETAWKLSCSMLRTALFKASVCDDPCSEDEKPSLDASSTFIASHFVAYLLGTFCGVSRKYSQLYAVEYSFRSSNSTTEPLTLLTLFLQNKKVTRALVMSYTAPHAIRIYP